MRSFLVLGLCIAGCIFSTESRLVRRSPDPMAVVKEIIYSANDQIAKMNMSVISVESYEIGNGPIKLTAKNVSLQKFDTLQLVGDQQSFLQTDTNDSSVFTFDLVVGLETLLVEADLELRAFPGLKGNGVLKIDLTGEDLRAMGNIISRNDFTCSAKIDAVVLTKLGHMDISFTNHWLLNQLLQFFTKFVYPNASILINPIIAKILQNTELQTQFEKAACEPFVL